MRIGRFFIPRRTLALTLTVLGVLVALWFTPTNYVMSVPGSATDTSDMIITDAVPPAPETGRVLLTTVFSREANALLYVVGGIYPRANLTPTTAYLRPGEDFDDYLRRTRQMMQESQDLAKYVAFDHLGYDVAFDGDGVLVVSIRADSLARDILAPGDVIVEAAGEPMRIVDDLLDLVGRKRPGEDVTLTVLREEEGEPVRYRENVTLIESPDAPGAAIIGIGVTTERPRFVFPFEVSIDAGNIGGPSAGLAFTLSLIDRLTPDQSLLDGRNIACTGTVNVRGEVGSVGGVRLKAYAAERAGADAFLVPKANIDDARKASVDIEIVPVADLEDALAFLRAAS